MALAVPVRTFKIDRFLGVNESPDGDTGLRLGEAASMRNFRITKEGNLKIRPGYLSVLTVAADHPIRGMWHGNVAGAAKTLVACNGHVYSINLTTLETTDLGTLTDAPTEFFAFGGNVYILNGNEYKKWTGTGSIADVEGYVPIIRIAAAPSTGSGGALEQVNKLTGSKWVWYSALPDSTIFKLPETGLASVDTVKVNNATVTTGFTVDLTAGTVTFTEPPGEGVNNVKIKYTVSATDRATVLAQKFSDLYNGATDARVFVYGDGTNKAYYSGLEYVSGLPTAEYFPDLNVQEIGASNTPITSIIRHFNKLMAFKSDGTYMVDYGTWYDVSGALNAGFYTIPIEKDIGHIAPGQVKLANNYPVSLHGNSVYRWGLIYSSGTQDERAAKRISDAVGETLSGMTLASAFTFDNEYNREFWIVQDDTALVWNYSGEVDQGKNYKYNTWSIFTDLPATHMIQIDGEVYFGTADGKLCHLDASYRSDDGTAIDAYWESGSMAFDREDMQKGLSEIFVAMKPELNSRITLTLESNKKSDFSDKVIQTAVLNFLHADFNHWSFLTNLKPQTRKIRMRAKKFTSLKLILESNSVTATATVLSVVLPVSYTGKAR